ncbi:MAG: DUF1572 family protein [Ginsengibacter sp.]
MNLAELFERDLNKLIEEINLFKSESDIWKTKKGITNSVGNLTLHLLGNLNHFIGKTLGNTDFVRNRDEEFSLKNIPREKLINNLKELKETIKNTLSKLTTEDLKKDFPLKIRDEVFSTELMLTYLLAHLSYHLGQVNYLRRIMTSLPPYTGGL